MGVGGGFTGFYGYPEAHRRRSSWALLDQLHSLYSLPWLCVGDFNETLTQAEHLGIHPRPLRRILEFREAVNRCQLVDMGFIGVPFTWDNYQDDQANVQARLDRALANPKWLESFPSSTVTHGISSYSDHIPLVVQIVEPGVGRRRRRRPRRFEEKWSSHPECENVIRAAWDSGTLSGSPMFILCEKIKACRTALWQWSRRTFGGDQDMIQARMTQLETITNQNNGGQYSQLISSLRAEINALLCRDEQYWRQRSRMVWLAAGDKNTRFFHQFATQRHRTNTISGLFDENGRWCSTEEEITGIASHYFENIFCTSYPTRVQDTLEAVESVVCDSWNQQLLVSFSAEEVKKALFDMHPSKAPGPDGMSSFFYKIFWHIVGPDVTSGVLSVLNSSHLLWKINHSLIPKKKNPDKMSDYRPISLCNVIYKLISKVLANRMKTVLEGIISDSQSAFVPGRLITDNVAVAFEIMNSLKNRRFGSKGLMALKLDMSKAYDRVEWSFLELIMHKLGFAERWVSLVMECITTVSYSVLIDGEPKGYIRPSRGIRQGDPLSPYLFLLYAEGLTALIRQAERMGHITGVSISRGGPRVSHLLFADDSLLFCQASIEASETLMRILSIYEDSSGQKLNKDKTAIFFSRNTRQNVREEIHQFWGSTASTHFGKYLGLPPVVGRAKKLAFNDIKERVAKRIHGWKERFLSKAGREILIKAVAQAIPTYSMSCFLLPKTWCSDLNGMMAKYWWGQQDSARKIHWVKWESMCRENLLGVWGSNSCTFSIERSSLSKGGDSSKLPTPFLAGCSKLSIFRLVLFWRLLWGLTLRICGEAFWRAEKCSKMG
jgi:hypothetical protein